MKRTTICILIGIAGSLIAYGFIQYKKNTFRYYYANLPTYNGELKIRIGDSADDKRSVVTTLGQIKSRLDIKTEQVANNNFRLSVKDALDTVSTKKLIVESIDLRFLETYSLGDLQNELTELDKELVRRKKQITDTSDKYAFLSEPDNNETKKKNGIITLQELINFFHPYQSTNGMVRYPAELGTIRISDTAYLNKILNEEKIRKMFPENSFFAYGKYDGRPTEIDLNLNFYVIKIPDPKFYPCPTGDNVEDCKSDFDPLGNPMLLMKFDAEGSGYWYDMTKRNIGKPIAMVTNNIVLTAPAPESAIQGGESRITGNFSLEEVRSMAAMIRSRKLELPVTILESKFKPSKRSLSIFWMLGLVFIFMTLMAYGVSFLIKPASKP